MTPTESEEQRNTFGAGSSDAMEMSLLAFAEAIAGSSPATSQIDGGTEGEDPEHFDFRTGLRLGANGF
jgi:hypothetical protein